MLAVSDELVDIERLAAPAELPVAPDLDLLRRLHWCIVQAERALGFPFNSGTGPLDPRLDRIIERALPGRLDPLLYRACWLLRQARHLPNSDVR